MGTSPDESSDIIQVSYISWERVVMASMLTLDVSGEVRILRFQSYGSIV